ncbi:MAG: YgjV family protein [Clostridia bacterium]|nr:YgjV family protein [Clostridia bacterium]
MQELWLGIKEFFTITPENLWVQLVGFVGLILSVSTFQTRSHKAILTIRSLEEFVFAVQYLMLGSYTAFGLYLVGPIRNVIFRRCIKKGKSTLVPQIGFSLFMVVYSVLTWEGLISLVVMTAKVLTTVAFGIKNTGKVRLMTFPASCMWIFHSIVKHSMAGLIADILGTASLLIAIIRFDLLGKAPEKQPLPAEAPAENPENN